MFECKLFAGWADMDFNSHMRNMAYLDKSADARMMFFAAQGFPMAEFRRLRLGPVVMRDEIEYYREFHLLDEVIVRMSLAGLSPDGARMAMRNDFYREDKLAARVTSFAGWLDLEKRKLAVPPDALRQAMERLERTEDFTELKPL